MVRMDGHTLSTVMRWFDAVPRSGRGLPQHLSGPLSGEERAVLAAGRTAVLAALDDPDVAVDEAAGPAVTSIVRVSEDAAGWFADYLGSFAAGVAGARR